ncbi:MAG: porin family protein [Bacteroidales bacterium]|nr:porin family protein [Bacteroidales bacterium]
MKRRITYIVLSLIFLMIHVSSSGQKQKPKNESWYDERLLHFGFSLGLNTMDFNITPSRFSLDSTYLYPEVSNLMPGINIQIVTDLRPGKYFDIRFLPGLSLGQRYIRFYRIDPRKDPNLKPIFDNQQRLGSSFLEFPLLLKFKGDRLNNVRPYVIGGFNYRYDLAKENNGIKLKRSGFYYELGAGLDFYLTYFKLSVELKMSNGIGDVLDRNAVPLNPQYLDAIKNMKSQIWVLAFHFE